jgi:hypothetical protein
MLAGLFIDQVDAFDCRRGGGAKISAAKGRTTEMRGWMAYTWIFVACYAAAFVGWLSFMMKRQAALVRVMLNNGVPEAEIDVFRHATFPKTILTLLWSTFFTGSVVGAIVSGLDALLH